MFSPTELMKHYVIDPQDSYFVDAKFEAVKGCSFDIQKYHENKSKVVRDIYQRIFNHLGFI